MIVDLQVLYCAPPREGTVGRKLGGRAASVLAGLRDPGCGAGPSSCLWY